MPQKKFKLSSVELDELSLVDSPANQYAKVLLFKRGSHPKPTPEDDEEPEDFGKVQGVKFVIGFKPEGGSDVQSIIFDQKTWDKEKATQWLKDNDFSSSGVDETANTLRFRQHDPSGYKRFRIIRPGAKAEASKLSDGSRLRLAGIRAGLLLSELCRIS